MCRSLIRCCYYRDQVFAKSRAPTVADGAFRGSSSARIRQGFRAGESVERSNGAPRQATPIIGVTDDLLQSLKTGYRILSSIPAIEREREGNIICEPRIRKRRGRAHDPRPFRDHAIQRSLLGSTRAILTIAFGGSRSWYRSRAVAWNRAGYVRRSFAVTEGPSRAVPIPRTSCPRRAKRRPRRGAEIRIQVVEITRATSRRRPTADRFR